MTHTAPNPSYLALRVNGEIRETPADTTVQGLLELLQLDRRRIAIAVEREVVPRSEYATRRLADGDRIEILEAVGGG